MSREFYDYGTASVDGSNVIDLHKTGMSFYDDFLKNNPADIKYLEEQKNLKGEVVMMSPEEYFKACSEYGFPGRHPSVQSLKRQRAADEVTLDHLTDVLTVIKKRFPMPILNKAQSAQEGLHRMYVIGELFGWGHKVPVLIVDWADKQRAYDEAKRARINRIEYNIERSVKEALRYKFTNIEELKEQIQWELDKQFKYNDDDIEVPVKFDLTEDSNTKEFVVSLGAATYRFDYEDVTFIDSDSDSDYEIDDIDDEETEDFLVRYFGDNWRETHPHLKSLLHNK